MAEEVIGLLFGVEGGGEIDGASGKRIIEELTKIVKKINSGKTTVPKVKLDFDATKASETIKELKKQLQEVAKLGNVNVTGMPRNTINAKITDSDEAKKTANNYKELTATVKEYHKALAEIQKEATKSTEVSNIGGVWSTNNENFKIRIANVNDLQKAYNKLGLTEIQAAESSGDIAKSHQLIQTYAEKLNISIDEYINLLLQSQVAANQNAMSQEKAANSTQHSWAKNTAKIHEYILRQKDVVSKNREIVTLMRELENLMATGDPKNLTTLLSQFEHLQTRIRETGADIETIGQKLTKAFGGKLTALIAGLIAFKLSQKVREIVVNVVKLDEAMTDLQIASGKTRSEVRLLINDYANLGNQIGATTLEIAESADTWLRQGHNTADTNKLITNSMMLSKLGQIESAEATKALTSAMKGYNVTVEDSIGIVDKFTAVDMVAATSAGDIATAMAETAVSARVAGVSMDKLIGYITTVAEVTQDGAESVGTFYRTLFARMNNVKAGKFIDDETGEALNDVEKTLSAVGIVLRDVNGIFRDSGAVLDDVATRWESFNSTQQHAIATAFAGTRQQEKFFVLMENYGIAMDYAEVAANSAGNATEKFSNYTESLAGKLDSLQATFEKLSMTILNSDWLIAGVEILNNLLSVVNNLLSLGDGFLVKTALLITTILLLTTGITKLTVTMNALNVSTKITTMSLLNLNSQGIMGLITLIPKLISGLIYLIKTHGLAQVSALGLKGTLELLNINPVMLTITAIVAAGAALKYFSERASRASEKAREHAQAMKEMAESTKSEVEKLDELIEKYKELASTDGINAGNREEVYNIQDQINTLVKDEVQDLILVNSTLEEQLALLQKIKTQKYGENLDDYAKSYTAAINSANLAYESGTDNLTFLAEWSQNAIGVDVAIDGWDLKTQKILNSVEGITATWAGDVLGFYSGKGYSKTSTWIDADGAEESLERIRAVIKALEDDVTYDHKNSEAYKKFLELEAAYEPYIKAIQDASKSLLSGVIEYTGVLTESKNGIVDSTDEYTAFRNEMIKTAMASEHLSEALKDQTITHDDVIASVDRYLSLKFPKYFDELNKSVWSTVYQLKSFLEILESIQGQYDVLSKAMEDMNELGYLSAGTLEKLLGEYPELEKYLTMTAYGYTLAEGALEDYLNTQKEVYLAELALAEAGSENYEIAYTKLERLLAAIATLELSKVIERETEALKAEKEAWENQLDAYKELINLRKELLNSYAEELKYQKELEKKQKNISKLQTQLSIAKLDNSAAGQARVRELEAALQKAQEELEDFTLEHAIDVLTKQLDSQYAQYKSFIDAEVAKITTAIGGVVDALKETAVDTDTLISKLLEEYLRVNPPKSEENDENNGGEGDKKSGRWTSYQDAVNAGWGDKVSSTLSSTLHNKYGGYQEYLDAMYAEYLGDTPTKPAPSPTDGAGNPGTPPPTYTPLLKKWNTYQDVIDAGYSDKVKNIIDFQNDAMLKKLYGSYELYITRMYEKYAGSYHTGGFVGGLPDIKNNEEFAKLLKGEFVVTSHQMTNFMDNTLPQMASFGSSGGHNEFKAPLINIVCESVTSESFPKIERLVKEAVGEIQKQLDSGMSRTGYKRPTKRLLI